jgi:putative flavoprotein involved in K+ transport
MLNKKDEAAGRTVEHWLAAFEQALTETAGSALVDLFHPKAHWRDLVALTWHISTVSGSDNIAEALGGCAADVGARRFEIDPERAAPRRVVRAGEDVVEGIFRFETSFGRGSGVLRLLPGRGKGAVTQALTLLTALEELSGFEETTGRRRPSGDSYSRDFRGPNWLDRRKAAIAFADRDPAVLVVGGGQAGLSIAARLTQLDIDTLIVDREARVGDNWRKRYHALSLHNQVHVNHLPYMPFPPTWPTYIPKDKIAGWFEAYAEIMELNFWTDTEFLGGNYDPADGRWTVGLRSGDGQVREMHPRHLVMATGVSGIPNLPKIPSLEAFAGRIAHSSEYGDSAAWSGRRALVLGTGTSGHDIAQDLYSHGATVTLVQRSPTTVVNVEPSAQLPYALYDEGPSLADCDLLAASMPYHLLRKTHELVTAEAMRLDKDLLDGLTRAGFRIDWEDETGWQFKYLRRGGGYYFNVGCSELIVNGEIGLVQYGDIETFVPEGARLVDGGTLQADLIVLATGYKGQEHQVRQLFGDGVADRVGHIWGFDPVEQELRNMFVRTGQPGLWFIAGSFAQCRIYSKYLALQLKACEEGMISSSRSR